MNLQHDDRTDGIEDGIENLEGPVNFDPILCRKIIDENYDVCFTVALKRMGHRQNAEDAVQEGTLGFLRFCERHGVPPGNPAGYLYVCVLNACERMRAQRARIESKEVVTADPNYAVQPDKAQPLDRELRAKVAKAIQNLPEKQRRAVVRKYYNEFTVLEIATELDQSENTVKTHLQRARDKLRRWLAPDASPRGSG